MVQFKVTFNEDKTRFAIVGNTMELSKYLEDSAWNSDGWSEDTSPHTKVTSPYKLVNQLLIDLTKPRLVEGETADESVLLEDLGAIFQDGWIDAHLYGTEYSGTESLEECEEEIYD